MSSLWTFHLPGRHPQKAHGGKGGTRLYQAITKAGGFTYRPKTRKEPSSGMAVSPYPNRSKVVPLGKLTPKVIQQYRDQNKDLLSKPGHHLGGWHDTETGKVYLDISVVVKTHSEARKLSEDHDQIAYFNLRTFETVTVNREAKSGQ